MDDTFHANVNMGTLHALFLRAPKQTGRAVSKFLNDEAFSYRELGPRVLKERLTIRNAAFVQSMFRVEKANPEQSPDKQVAKAGSIKTARFSGWAELVTGQEPERKRTIGSNARGGDMEAQAQKGSRLLEGLELEKPSNFDDIPERMRIPAMLSILARNPDYTAAGHGLFIIEGGNWVPGLYRFQKGQTAKWAHSKKKGDYIKDKRDRWTYEHPAVTRVQTFGKAPKGQRYNWPQITIERLRAWFKPADVWAQYFKDAINSIK